MKYIDYATGGNLIVLIVYLESGQFIQFIDEGVETGAFMLKRMKRKCCWQTKQIVLLLRSREGVNTMDKKHAAAAFEKLQKAEHLLRLARDRKGLGRITPQEFRQEESRILERFALTDAEQRAYDYYNQVTKQRKAKN